MAIGSGKSNEQWLEARAAVSVASKGEGIGEGREPEGPVNGGHCEPTSERKAKSMHPSSVNDGKGLDEAVFGPRGNGEGT